MTPLATRLRDLADHCRKFPENPGLTLTVRECKAVLALLDAAKDAEGGLSLAPCFCRKPDSRRCRSCKAKKAITAAIDSLETP